MIVAKFGGTSVKDAERIQVLKKIISKEKRYVIVVSAFSKVTDALEALSHSATRGEDYCPAFEELKAKHFQVATDLMSGQALIDVKVEISKHFKNLSKLLEGISLTGENTPTLLGLISSTGEYLSSAIIYAYLRDQGSDIEYVDGSKVIKVQDTEQGTQVLQDETEELIQDKWKTVQGNTIMPGFVASDEKNKKKVLGRGGSDYSAALVAAALEADRLDIWTDVDGIMTADPRIVKDAYNIPYISYEELMEMAHFGMKAVYFPSVQPVYSKKIPLTIKNSYQPEAAGTTVMTTEDLQAHGQNGESKYAITGFSKVNKISLVNVIGRHFLNRPGIAERIFSVLHRGNISVITISQSSSESSVCMGIEAKDAHKTMKLLREHFKYDLREKHVELECTTEPISIIAVVGDNMKNRLGLAGKVFQSLGRNGVNIRMIAQGSSERNISLAISSEDDKKALNVLHEEFFVSDMKTLHIYAVGVGNVGGCFIDQLHNQSDYLKKEQNILVKVLGISNSKKMVLDKKGISLDGWRETLAASDTPTDLPAFVNTIKEHNRRNSIFVDNTASEDVSKFYLEILRIPASVVGSNKIAAASSYQHYVELKQTALRHNVSLEYETNVGAALPLINTLRNIVRSGDKVRRIQAILSGSLNFIVNNYKGESTFIEVLLEAEKQGFTEPDPRIDLSGIDVIRKIVILARECGYELEVEDVTNNSFLPPSCENTTSVDDFKKNIENSESHFKAIRDKAEMNGNRLRHVATFEDGKAWIGLEEVSPEHDFYNLEGKDNIVLISSDRYHDQPLIVKGAGAGADITASGVFADVINIAQA